VIWLVGMANAINWIDGLDGLAAGVSGIAAVVMHCHTVYATTSSSTDCSSIGWWSIGIPGTTSTPPKFSWETRGLFYGFTLAGV